MKLQRVGTLFTIVLLCVYLTLSIPVLVLTGVESDFYWIIFSLLYECLALGIALELTELLLGISLASRVHAKASKIEKSQISIAILYVCCDDVDEVSLQSLSCLQEFDVFILDDSKGIDSQRRIDRSGLTTIRRADRLGFKAGNLNNWLIQFGDCYDYFVILDSDSVMTPKAIWDLVAIAEHPDNEDVAIVQSKILPCLGNSFQRLMGCQAKIRLRILSRVHDRMGWSLSHGHNNLHRLEAVRQVGGFDLSSTCEDTLISLRLAREGWRIILVETLSHDAEPHNVFTFRRRMVRWARQTADLVITFRSTVTRPHAWLIARHLFSYMLPMLCIVLLAFVTLTTRITMSQALEITCGNFMLKDGYIIPGLISYLLLTSFTLVVALRLSLFILSGGRLRTFLLSTILGGAVSSFCTLHVIFGMIQSFASNRTGFSPTGIYERRSHGIAEIIREMAIPWFIYVGITGVLFSKPGLLVFGLNLVWAMSLVTAPFILFAFHRDLRRGQIP